MPAIGGILKLKNVNDFIMPSQACVIRAPASESTTKNLIRIHSRKKIDGNPVPTKPIKITLDDCLACSGCVTSTEELF